jgi:hypothetical protein
MKKELSPKQRDELLTALQAQMEARQDKLWSLAEMERTGGEPDVVAHDKKSGEFVFFDCSEQSPAGCTSLCCDRQKLNVVNPAQGNPALRDWRGHPSL